MAPLLPKLRGHFAEFLRESYLAHLGILYHPTCVGFGYWQLCLNGYRAIDDISLNEQLQIRLKDGVIQAVTKTIQANETSDLHTSP